MKVAVSQSGARTLEQEAVQSQSHREDTLRSLVADALASSFLLHRLLLVPCLGQAYLEVGLRAWGL